VPPPVERPPYPAAVAVFVVVLAGYVITLAPTVTFWDAGEFIAASKILGIPHPPGTPLFVLLGHVWGLLIPFGEYAWRLNLMAAVFSAAGAAFWFLVAHELLGPILRDLEPGPARVYRLAGAAAGALASAFAFTVWQNSNETEVYMVATFSIAAITWLALRWRATRGTVAASRILLLAVFLGGVSIGNHLLALLVGPALVAFLGFTVWRDPSADPATARREAGEVAVVAGLWAVLIGTGLGSTTLVAVGAVCFLAAAAVAAGRGAGLFAALGLLFALAGVTTYLFLFIRAGQQPIINEADPSTWEALLAVIRREQYPPRTPFDDPTVLSGPGNPGRNLRIVALQLLNYLQYFDWQWARGLTASVAGLPGRSIVSVAFLVLGIRGLLALRRADRGGVWLLFLTWLVTGLGLVAYMNFKPGFSIGYAWYPDPSDHEVRERDYFFVASFIVWGVVAGMGLAVTARALRRRWRFRPAAAGAVFAVALVPFLLNFSAASRRHGADATLAADFAYNLLNSVPPYGILFTYGDNDTFPLWWAQEVEGIRRDVTVVCLALAETDWYMRQLRDNPVRPFDEAMAPALWRGRNVPMPDWPLHTMTDEEIRQAVPQLLPAAVTLRVGPHEVTLPAGRALYGKDFLALRVLQQNVGRRPVAWAITATESFFGLDPWMVQQGLAMRVMAEPPDTLAGRYDTRRVMGVPLDLVKTDSLLFGVYRYGDLLARGARGLESTSQFAAGTLSVPFTQMAYAAEARGDLVAMERYLSHAVQLSVNPALWAVLDELRGRPTPER
jgi:hypothetical protein